MSWQQVDWVETGSWWSTRLIVLFVLLGALVGMLVWEVNQLSTFPFAEPSWEPVLNAGLIQGSLGWMIVVLFLTPTARAVGFGYDRLLVDFGLSVREAPWSQVRLLGRRKVSLDYRTTVTLTSRQMSRLLEILPRPATPVSGRG